jgi:hypothetical protein
MPVWPLFCPDDGERGSKHSVEDACCSQCFDRMGKKARNHCFVCHTEFKQREGGQQRCPECHSRTVGRLAKPSVATAGAASPAKRSKYDGESEGEQRVDISARTEGAYLAFASERGAKLGHERVEGATVTADFQALAARKRPAWRSRDGMVAVLTDEGSVRRS